MRGIVTLVALWVLLATTVRAADNFANRVYPTPRLQEALQLDGRLDETAWQSAPVVSGFAGYEDNRLAEVQMGFRVLYDQQALYFGFHCDEPNMANLVATRVPRDEHAIFRTETIELFLDPGHTHDLYYQLAFNAAGSLYDGERENTSWNSGATVAPHLGPDFWSVEVAVPWTALGGEAKAGRVIGFNVNRNRRLGSVTENLTWTQVQAAFHDPLRFAHLVLSGTAGMITALEPELRKGERSGPIHVYTAEGYGGRTYGELAAAELADLERLIEDMAATQERETNPMASAELARRVEEHRRQLVGFRQQAEALDGLTWNRLNGRMQALRPVLGKAVWDARLNALLSGF